MATTNDGQFTLAELLRLTYSSKYRTRYEYAKRDVIKRIVITKETTLHPDRPNAPTVTYIFETKSFPQYTPYNKHTTGKQKKYSHEYDNILSIVADEDGKFSLNSTKWKYRLGSQKKWVDKPPQKLVKSLYRETSAKWKDAYAVECEKIKKKYSNKKDRDKALGIAKKNYDDKIDKHKKQAKYLNSGDYNAKFLGINGDFAFRVAPVFQFWGHLYGRNVEGGTGDPGSPFAPKHMISLVDALIKLNILK